MAQPTDTDQSDVHMHYIVRVSWRVSISVVAAASGKPTTSTFASIGQGISVASEGSDIYTTAPFSLTVRRDARQFNLV